MSIETTYTRAYIDRALTAKMFASARGTANGVCELDSTGKVPAARIPGGVGGGSSITSVNGVTTGAVTITADSIGAARIMRAPRIVSAAGTALSIAAPSATNSDTLDVKLNNPSVAVTLPSGMLDGGTPAAVDIVVWFRQGTDVGGRDFTVTNSNITWIGGTKPSLSTVAASGLTPIVFTTLNGGTSWIGSGPVSVTSSGGTTLPANATGWLHNDGTGTLAWTTPSSGTGGAPALTRTARTSAYTASVGDYVSADTTSGTFLITLPAAATAGKGRIVVGWDNGATAPTIGLSSTDTFNGTSSAVMTPPFVGRRYQFESDGVGIWSVTAGYIPTSEVVLSSLAVAKGDILVATGAKTFARLAKPSSTSVLQMDSAGNASWVAPAAGGSTVVPGQVLSQVEYDPTTAQTDITTSSTTLSDVAAAAVTSAWTGITATSFDLTFSVPSSGQVTVRAHVYGKVSVAGVQLRLAIYDTTGAALVPNSTVILSNSTTFNRLYYEKLVSGLTAGATLTYRLQWAMSGTGSNSVSVGGVNGPVRFSVAAA